jgi:uncharacterized protein (TIGR02996 family)
MGDWAAFMQTICESPEDDTVRLIYADWLEEHDDVVLTSAGVINNGYIEQAEFIRVQIELAGETHEYCKDDYCVMTQKPCRIVALRRREQELWPRVGSICGLIGGNGVKWVYRRGFVGELHLPLADWIEDRECERCAGIGMDGWSSKNRKCRLCHGTGRLPALGPLLVAAAPLTRVRFTDVEPRPFGMLFGWSGDQLPLNWLRILGGNPASNFALYNSEQAALDAISRVALAEARERAFGKSAVVNG